MTVAGLEGRVALVTGGGRGIGRAHCLQLARSGARVVVNDPGVSLVGSGGEKDPAQSVVEEIWALGGDAVANHGSVSEETDVDFMLTQALDVWGRLDIVLNNAGVLRDRPLVQLSGEDFDAVVAVHLKGAFLTTRMASRHWLENPDAAGRRIINTTSSVGMVGEPKQAAYAAAKAGILGLTMTTAKEMAPHGITCNALSPVAATRMTETFGPAWYAGTDGSYAPFDPRNAALVAAYLASDDASWLTGQVLRVEGNSVSRMVGWSRGDGYHARAIDDFLSHGEISAAMRQIYGTFPPAVLSEQNRG